MARDGRRSKGDALKRIIAERLRAKIEAEPEHFAKAIELGVFDSDWLQDPTGRSFREMINLERVQQLLGERVKAEPSVLAQLDLSALEALGSRWSVQPGERSPHEEQRLTVVFTDLEGFTSFTSSEGDRAASELLAGHYDAVATIVRARGGRVVKTIGDGHMLTFPEASAAVLASVELLDEAPDPLALRAGAHAGDVLVADGDVLGHVVNVAARVTGAAGGGSTLVTAEVRDAAQPVPGITFGALRPESFKGIDEPVSVCDVVAA